jgi:tryptophanyl-tRNA synthetase
VDRLSPIAGEMRRLTADPAQIDGILTDGAARAREIAQPIFRDVKRVVGFVRA